MKNWRILLSTLALAIIALLPAQAGAQAFNVTWPLASDQSFTASPSSAVTGFNEAFNGGTSPTVSIWGYSSQGQQLNAGTTGWLAGTVEMGRHLQFDAQPAPGHQLTVTNISFEYGGNNLANQIKALVMYSTDNWITATPVAGAPTPYYPVQAMATFSAAIPSVTVQSGHTFSLRILPYADIPSIAGAPTFAVHRNVQISGNSSASGGPDLSVTKSCMVLPNQTTVLCTVIATNNGTAATPTSFHMDDNVIGAPSDATFAGTSSNISCTPGTNWTPNTPLSCNTINPNGIAPNGGSNSYQFRFNLPTGGTINNCATAETLPTDTTPGNNTGCWTVTIPSTTVTRVQLPITKSTGVVTVAGTYNFNLSCTGAGGPYTGPNPVSVTLPGSGSTTAQVPQGDTCTVTENQPPSGLFSTPIWGGSSDVSPNGWSATVGPVSSGDSVSVRNTPSFRWTTLTITKSTGVAVIAGTYAFNLSCSDSAGDTFVPSLPLTITLPGNGTSSGTVQIPYGFTCTVTETASGSNWDTPVWSGTGVTGNGWSATVGPYITPNAAVTATNRQKGPSMVPLVLNKILNGKGLSGTFNFTIACTGSGGPYQTTTSITAPMPGTANLQVPLGDTCTFTENLPSGSNWAAPTWSGSYVAVSPATGLSTQVGPVNGSAAVNVTNQQQTIEQAKLQITKSTGAAVVPGTYTFNIACTGPGGPYTGTNPITITLPGTGTAIPSVPQGDTCTLTENQPTTGSWSTPTWSGTGVTGSGWSATVGPISSGATIAVNNNPGRPEQAKLQITKSTGAAVIAGTYTFNIACTGPGGSYTGTNPITITLPGSGAVVAAVPQGDTCTLTENQPTTGSWSTPTWSGTGVTGNGWSATVGPISSGATVAVNNNPGRPELAKLQITKSTGAAVVPGTYTFNIACTGPGGSYTGTNPITITLPGSGAVVAAVPQGDTCTLTENQPTTGSWSTPTWSGTGVTGSGWSATVGPISSGATIAVNNNPGRPELAKLQITKSTGAAVVPGTYTFNIACTGPGGSYTGTNPITITLPGSGAVVAAVPQGDTCTLTENQPTTGSWSTPTWSGTGVTGSGWSATVGPISSGATIAVNNNPGRPELAKLQITKSTGAAVVPGTYTFNIACTGPGGPYTGTNPITITLPGTGTAIPSVPQGDTCTLTENQPTTGSWSTPTWSGTGVTGNGWSATVGPISSGATVAVNNNQKSAELVDLTIAKSTGDTVVPGTYYFNIACTGPGGPFSTMYPVQIVLPGAATYVAHVPAGDTCTVTEGQLDQAVWNTPTWSGTGVTGNGWSAQVGPINAAESVKVTNNPKGSKLVTFGIEKVGLGSFTYTFNVVCGGPGGPYTGPNPITIAFPSSSGTFTVPYLMQVPQGDTCTLTENQPASGAWNSPTWIGNGVTPSPSSGWTTTVGPINPGNSLKVTNNPKRGEPVKVPLTIGKSFASDIVPGTYNFNIVCNGPGGSQNLSTIATLPTPGLGTVQVYQGSTCTVTELAPSGSGWGVPTWSGNNVVPNGWTAQVGPINAAESVKVTNRKDIKQVKLTIGKKLAGVTSGSFSFNVSCTGPGGSYSGTAAIVLPGTGTASVAVPQGDTCTVTENSPGAGWLAPSWSGPVTVTSAGVSVGPMNTDTTIGALNTKKRDPALMKLQITKQFAGSVVSGSYHFSISCNGPGGPYSSSAVITLPGSNATEFTQVPQGDSCTVTESNAGLIGWGTPTWSGSGVAGNGWSATLTVMPNTGAGLQVTNHPPNGGRR